MGSLKFYSALFGPEAMLLFSGVAFSFFSPVGHGRLDSFSSFLLALFIIGLLPYAVFIHFVKSKKADYALSDPKMRDTIFPRFVPFFLGGAFVFWSLDDRLMALFSLEWAVLFSALFFFNKLTKISLHTAGIAATVAAFSFVYGGIFWLLLPAFFAIALARIGLGAHDLSQTLLGAIVGAMVSVAVFAGFS